MLLTNFADFDLQLLEAVCMHECVMSHMWIVEGEGWQRSAPHRMSCRKVALRKPAPNCRAFDGKIPVQISHPMRITVFYPRFPCMHTFVKRPVKISPPMRRCKVLSPLPPCMKVSCQKCEWGRPEGRRSHSVQTILPCVLHSCMCATIQSCVQWLLDMRHDRFT